MRRFPRHELVMDAVALVAVVAVVAIGAAERVWVRGDPAAPSATTPSDRLVWREPRWVPRMRAWLAGTGNFALPQQETDDIWHGYLVEG